MFKDMRMVAADEVDGLIIPRAQLMTIHSREVAVDKATSKCPEIPWSKVFDALESAGLIYFNNSK